MKSKYQLTLEYLFSQLPMYQRVGSAAFKKDLSNILAMCKLLGNPHQKFNSIHIAGTNGKGSVAHMLSAIFTAAGKKVGLYTSPHYKDFRERVKIDGKYISKKDVIYFVEKNRDKFKDINPSFFEWTVALAFHHFAKENVDIAIIETGLGGRLDSTNIVTPLLSIITNIGYDHQQFLGETLPEIAFEKAGIIKENIPVIIGESRPETLAVFNAKAKKANAPIFYSQDLYSFNEIKRNTEHILYEVRKNNTLLQIAVNQLGPYQVKNLSTVLHAMDVFRHYHPSFIANHYSSIKEGLRNLKKLTSFRGRWEILQKHPTIVCDSAHNTAGIQLALKGINAIDYDKLHIVLGMVSDKAHEKVLGLFPIDAKYYFSKANIPRGLPASELKELASQFNLNGKAYSSVRKALAAAKSSAKANDLIFVGGSVFVVAEVI